MLNQLIHLVSLSDNIYLQRKLEEVQKILMETPNDVILGEKIRKYLQN